MMMKIFWDIHLSGVPNSWTNTLQKYQRFGGQPLNRSTGSCQVTQWSDDAIDNHVPNAANPPNAVAKAQNWISEYIQMAL